MVAPGVFSEAIVAPFESVVTKVFGASFGQIGLSGMITFGIGSSIGGCFVADPPKIWEKMDGFVVAAAADRSFKAGNDCAKEEEVFKPRRKTFRLLIMCWCV